MSNIVPHEHKLTRADRTAIKNHHPVVIWFTGLSGSGKSTIANALEERLNRVHHTHTYLLDGDNIRTGLNAGLGFAEEDRQENIRRIGEVTKLFYDAGLIVITAFISPFRRDRQRVEELLPAGAFMEILIDCPLEICEQRDPKGLYLKARAGQIGEFTGITSPYEAPLAPAITLASHEYTVEQCVDQLINYMLQKGIIPPLPDTQI
ncbi:MAG: adenylyl-sulfate kinase [Chloroflexi bacterium HGW-Chloroflexi-10]|nr:MAG: adenylyl-sulfate kinase [Chloroflexi bacterium HGW-Chloroflexi-10]